MARRGLRHDTRSWAVLAPGSRLRRLAPGDQQAAGRLFSSVLAIVIGAACGPSPTLPTRQRPTVLPAIDGLVREVDGGPIANAVVAVSSAGETGTYVSDSAGRFAVPSRDAIPGWPRLLRATLGAWGDRYFWGDPVLVPASVSSGPVRVELKLQPARQLTDASPVVVSLSDDALSFSQSDVFECHRCLALILPHVNRSVEAGFDLRVRMDQPARLRLLLVGTAAGQDVILRGAESGGATIAGLRVTRALLMASQDAPTLYIEKMSGPASIALDIELIPVAESTSDPNQP